MRGWLACLLLTTLGNVAVASQEEPTKPRILVRPGSGPQMVFDEARWEFWWYFNSEPYLRLRPSLDIQDQNGGEADKPFLPISQDQRQRSVIPILVSALRDKNPQLRAAAVQALAKSQDNGARAPLRTRLRDDEFPVRLSSLVSFGVFGSTYFLAMLEDALDGKDRELQERVYAAISIGLIGGSTVAETFRHWLVPSQFRAQPTQVQGALAHAVGIAGESDTGPLIRKLLDDRAVTDYKVRAYLTLSLGKCGDVSDLDRLENLLGDEETQIRRSAAIALGVLFREGAEPAPLKRASDALTRSARKDADLMVRNFSYIALGQIGGQESVKFLLHELEGTTKSHRPFVALALGIVGDPGSVPVLTRLFEKESELSYRAALAVAIGLHRDARAAPVLRDAFKNQLEPVFRGYVALALGMIRDVDSIAALEAVFRNANDVEFIPNTAVALGLLGARESVTILAERAVNESNEFVKQSLIFSLGLIGDQGAIAPLEKMFKDDTQPAYIREYAVIALGQLSDPQPVRGVARITIDSNYTIVSDFLKELFFIR